MDLQATVRWLRDCELIKALPQQYALGLDTRQFALSRAVFRDDCMVKGSLSDREEAIDPYFAALTTGVQRYPATMHLMGNQYLDLSPGNDSGAVETYAVAYHMGETPADDLVMGVRYQDAVARDQDDRWLIARRNVVAQWVRGPLPIAAQDTA